MARNLAGEPPSGRPGAAHGAPPQQPLDAPVASERHGAVELARTVKDDGRALLLYRRADDERS